MLNEDILKGNWNEIKGDVRRFFGKLTDDDLQQAEGNKDKLIGSLQKRYGYNRDEAEQHWGDFTDSIGNKWDQAMDDAGAAINRAAGRI